MTKIDAGMIKQLREKTGAGMMDCKAALSSSDGDIDNAIAFLRKKGLATAAKRAGRSMSQGVIQSYIHMGGKLGTMVEVSCETDFVAKSEDFLDFAKNVAMHIAATDPLGITPDDVPGETMDREREIYREQALASGKPEKIVDKIIEGKLTKFLGEQCLMNQAYVRDPDITIADLQNSLIAKIGENIKIKRFIRYQIGES